MSINSELEKLIFLRDRGDLTQAEFEKAKALLLSEESPETISSRRTTSDVGGLATGIPGLGLAAGVFVGNLLAISIASGDVTKGFVVGAIAAVLVVVFSLAARVFRSQ
ncbi:MAG: SHOCT domain-containing protein [Verrucomicrobia bacterium]|nr:SHOCT domain-containing protein [Verrucomicrobiota bacterium]